MKTRLAAAIRLLLANSDVEQKHLAKEWGCSESTVTRFLAGLALPEARTVVRIFEWSLGEHVK